MHKAAKELLTKRRAYLLEAMRKNCRLTDYQQGQLDLIKQIMQVAAEQKEKLQKFDPIEDAQRFLRLSK